MKKLFTLVALVCISVGAAQAQSKTTATKSKVVTDKSSLKAVTPKKADEKTVNATKDRGVNAKRVDGAAVLTKEQVDARIKEQSTKAKAKRTEEK